MASFKYILSILVVSFVTLTTVVLLFTDPYLTSATFINSRLNGFLNFLQQDKRKINVVMGSSELFINFSSQRLAFEMQSELPFYSVTSPDFPFEKQNLLIDKMRSLNVKNKIEKIIIPLSLASIGKSNFVRPSDILQNMAEVLNYSEILNNKNLPMNQRIDIAFNKLLYVNRLNDFSKKFLNEIDVNSSNQSGFSNIWLSPLVIESPAWNALQFGDYNFNKKTNAYFQFLSGTLQFNDIEHLKSIQYYEVCCQILTFKYFETGFNNFLTLIDNLKEVTSDIDIVYIPESPQTQAMRSVEAKKNIEMIKERLRLVVGVRFLDLQNQVLWQPNDYLDAVHLSEKGARKVEAALADFQ